MREKAEKWALVTLPVHGRMVNLDKKIGENHKKGLIFFQE